MKTVKKTLLHYQKGTSNKVYNVYLVEVSKDKYLVNFEYGRFGSTLREGSKTATPVELEKAQKLYDSLVVSKMNKDYKIKEGYDSTKQEEKAERKHLTSLEYKSLLLERLKKAGAVKGKKLDKVDNYEVSRLIYRAGELKIKEAEADIIRLYELETKEDNAFYYSVVWALGRLKTAYLKTIIEALREKLSDSSKYVVEMGRFLLKDEAYLEELRGMSLPMPYSASLGNSAEEFSRKVKLLVEMIEDIHKRYRVAESWNEKTKLEKELTPLLKQADELYLKLYIKSLVNESYREDFVNIISILPINELNFSLFRRLYKIAEMLEDYEVLGALTSLIESKKMACYATYDYYKSEYSRSVGCSKLYFKKRTLRLVKDLAMHNQEGYIAFVSAMLLGVNGKEKAFAPYKTDYYDNNWNLKHKHFDAFASHLTFIYALYGNSNRYMLSATKKVWEVANKSIKLEGREEMHKELWDKYAEVALYILSKSSVELVQEFAFRVLEDNPDVLASAPLSMLLPLLNAPSGEVRIFFFSYLKERYDKHQEQEIIEVALLSFYNEITAFALDVIAQKPEILERKDLVVDVLFKGTDYTFNRLLGLLGDLEDVRAIVDSLVSRVLATGLPLDAKLKERTVELLRKLQLLHAVVEVKDIEQFMRGTELSEYHLIAAELIRSEEFVSLEIPLALKEKIANYDHPEMLATIIYLLGKLSQEELMEAHAMLVSFLYHQEVTVHNEAKKIIVDLGQKSDYAKVLLQAIVEKSFMSASDDVALVVSSTVEQLKKGYSVINTDQLYRMLTAKSKLALRLGSLILTHYKASDFSVVQWARLAKNPNKSIRVWAYNAYRENPEKVKEAMPKSLMIFDTHWEDTRAFASEYFENFGLNSDEVVIVADSNHNDVQLFAKKMIEQGDYDREVILTKLSQHPALTIQKFVTDLMLAGMDDEQLLKMEYFFNTLLHSVNQNRVAKTRVMALLKSRIANEKVAKMVSKLASHHSASMVWADKELFVEMLSALDEKYDFELPLSQVEVEKREVV